MRDEGRKSVELNLDRQAGVFELKVRQRILRSKFGGSDSA